MTDEATNVNFTASPSEPSVDLPVEDFITQFEAWSLPPLELPPYNEEHERCLEAWCKRFDPVLELFKENRLLRGLNESLQREINNPGWKKKLISKYENNQATVRARASQELLRNQSENDED
jgi:hypothetical protein